MSGIATAIVGSAVIGGVMGDRASSRAADAQTRAAQDANATQLYMFDQNREDMQPWRDAGSAALAQLAAGTKPGGDYLRDFSAADFQRDPGYEFRLGEGTRTLENSAAARGGLLSGNTLKALARFGQDYASGEYGNAYNRWNADRTQRFNRLSSIAGIGQTATRDVATMGANAAGQVAQNQLAAGNARAAGIVGGANAWNNTLGSLQSMYFMNRMFPQAGQQAAAPISASTPTWVAP